MKEAVNAAMVECRGTLADESVFVGKFRLAKRLAKEEATIKERERIEASVRAFASKFFGTTPSERYTSATRSNKMRLNLCRDIIEGCVNPPARPRAKSRGAK